MRAWSLLLVAAFSLAGCAGSEPGPSGQQLDDALTEGLIPAPEWAIGDYWAYDNMNAAGEASAVTAVVTGEAGDDWILDTNEPQHAYYDALTDISYLGPVRKSDLAGSQGSDRVQFFDFPLEQNKTWKTTWDGLSVDIEVRHVKAGTAHLVAMDGDRKFAEYEYSNERRFFDYITFFDENGTQAYHMEASDSGNDFTGTVYRYELLDVERITASDVGAVSQPYTPEDGVTELAFHSTGECNGAPAGRMGVLFTSREEGAFHTPQLIAATQPILHEMILDCTEGQSAVSEDVVVLAPGLDYSLDHGILVQGGEMEIVIEPRILEAIEIA